MSNPTTRRARWMGVPLAAIVLVLAGPASAPAFGQDTLAEKRVRKMEAEIRALQRKVFPGDGKFFAPEITQDGSAGAAGQPATSAVTDILRRMDALEAQIARLTGQVEQNSNRIVQLEARAGIAGENASPVPAQVPVPLGDGGTPTSATPAPAPAPAPASAPAPAPTPPTAPTATPASAPTVTPAPKPAPAPTAAPSSRVRAVQAIVKPQTDDAGDDEYSYGYRLWDAKFYPEAQQQLTMFVDKYPSHARASWGRNLLGRAFLDDGKPKEAAKWFLQNYQADKRGDRAPDSLLYLGVAMKQLKDTKRACIALAEFSETYAAEAAGRLKSLYDRTRDGLDCG